MIPTLTDQIAIHKAKAAHAAKSVSRHVKKARELGNLADDLQNGGAHLVTVADKVRLAGWPDSDRMADQLTAISQTIYKRL